MVSAYLTAERGLGRIALSADVDMLAMLLVGGAHLLTAGRHGSPPDPDGLRTLIDTAIPNVAHQSSSRPVQT
jgi:hypothetical protein